MINTQIAIFVFVSITFFSKQLQAELVHHKDPKCSYATFDIEGWKVLVSARYKEHELLKQRVLTEVRQQLYRINQFYEARTT